MISGTTVCYGVACIVVLAFTGWNRSVSLRAFQLGAMLATICLATNLLNYTLYYPHALAPYPVIDAIGGSLASIAFWKRPRAWSLALATTFLVMGAIHTLFWYGQASGDGYGAVAPYMNRLGVVFNIQLALVCVPGGIERVRQFLAWYAAHRGPMLRGVVRSGDFRNQGEEL